MDWLNSGSKTLVCCVGMAGIAAMACFKVVTGQEALAAISGLAVAYGAVNMVQNAKTPEVPK